jgi:hypothetical protein
VRFAIDAILANTSESLQLHACVERSCVNQTITTASRQTELTVDDPSLMTPRLVRVLLQVDDSSGHQIFNATTDVQLHKVQPNGPDCPPTAYVGSVAATAAGQLEEQSSP